MKQSGPGRTWAKRSLGRYLSFVVVAILIELGLNHVPCAHLPRPPLQTVRPRDVSELLDAAAVAEEPRMLPRLAIRFADSLLR